MIDWFVRVFHTWLRYPLGWNWRFQVDNGRSYNRLKSVCRFLAGWEYARVKAIERISPVVRSLVSVITASTSPHAKNGDSENTFVYPHIKETRTWRTIRLLRLQPGRFGQPLSGTLTSCAMVTVYLWSWSFDMPEYDALSYCWGVGNATESIFLDGQPLSITSSLSVALQHLRLEDKERYLWIDQICIDQKSTAEKSYQVRRMGEIYANAQRTVVWLGPSTEESNCLFRTMDRIDDSMAENKSMYFFSEMQSDQPIYKSVMAEFSTITKDPSFPQQLVKDTPQKSARALFLEILSNPWFERMWILQEGALAKDILVQAGYQTASWRRFVGSMRIITGFLTSAVVPPKNYQSVEVLEVLRHTHYSLDGIKIELPRMMQFSRPREAGDMRDKIYGLMGLYTPWSVIRMPASTEPSPTSDPCERIGFSDYYSEHRRSGPQMPVVDYHRSEEHVFVDATLACLTSRRLEILKDCCAYAEVPDPGTEVFDSLHGRYISKHAPSKRSLPSWVIDWSTNVEAACRSPMIDDLRTKEQPFHASRDTQSTVRVHYETSTTSPSSTLLSNTTLVASGILFDEIVHVAPSLHTYGTLTTLEGRSIWKSWVMLACANADLGPYKDREGCITALWQSLITAKADSHDATRCSPGLGADFSSDVYHAIIGGRLPPGWECRATPNGKVYYLDHNTETTSWDHPREAEITDEEYASRVADLNGWLQRRGNRHINRRLFKTHRGYLGLSCPHVQPGDRVAIFEGGRLPFVLRPNGAVKRVDESVFSMVEVVDEERLFLEGEDGRGVERTFQMVGGECYIHGLVDGEALEIAKAEGRESEEIWLR